MKKCFTLIIVTIILSISCCTSVLARNEICGYKGCTRSTVNCENGTVYCDVHAAVHAKKDGYKVCAVGGCYDSLYYTEGKYKGYCDKHARRI